MKHDTIPPGLVRTLYAETTEYAGLGLGPARIARRLSDIHSLRVSPGTIRHWVVGDRKPLRRNVFKPGPSPALSYVIGANIGDGCTLTRSWCVKLEVTDLDFAQTFNSNMASLFSRANPNKVLTRHFRVKRLPMYVVKYSSKQLAKLLRLPLKKLLELASTFPREFLRGFFDAEGHVDVKAAASFEIRVGAENSNKALLLQIRSVPTLAFGIAPRIYQKRKSGSVKSIRRKSFRMRKNSYSLLISRFEDLKRFERQIGFSISRKNLKLKDALAVFQEYGRREGVDRWNKLYFKQGGEWVTRKDWD